MSLTDEKITRRKGAGAIRKGAERAVVDVEARVLELVAATNTNKDGSPAFVEEARIVDLLEIIRAGSSVSQAADDVAAIQAMGIDVGQAALGRAGISIIRALLGV